jgi:biopolymer transport protein TolR
MAEINVTPLVDVMLVLLIIFMVTAPMMQEGISVDLPSESGKPIPQQQTEQVVISVSKDGAIYLNEKKVSLEELAPAIKESAKSSPKQEVYLRADRNVPYGTVVKIMANLRNSGLANLGMITSPAEESSAGPTR